MPGAPKIEPQIPPKTLPEASRTRPRSRNNKNDDLATFWLSSLLARSWRRLGASWVASGASWAAPEAHCGLPGGPLGSFLELLLRLLWKMTKTLKIIVIFNFSWLFEVWGSYNRSKIAPESVPELPWRLLAARGASWSSLRCLLALSWRRLAPLGRSWGALGDSTSKKKPG